VRNAVAKRRACAESGCRGCLTRQSPSLECRFRRKGMWSSGDPVFADSSFIIEEFVVRTSRPCSDRRF
jgi:hypothetical protein